MAKRKAKKNPPMNRQEVITEIQRGRTDFSSEDLSGADLIDLDLSRMDFENADLSKVIGHRASFHRSSMIDASLEEGHFGLTNFTNAQLVGATLSDGEFSRARFQSATLTSVKAEGANFTKAKMEKIWAQYANFYDSYMDEVDLTDANLVGANFKSVVLRNAVLIGALITDADFTNADLSGTIYEHLPLIGAKKGRYGWPEVTVEDIVGEPDVLLKSGDNLPGKTWGVRHDWNVLDFAPLQLVGEDLMGPRLLLEVVGAPTRLVVNKHPNDDDAVYIEVVHDPTGKFDESSSDVWAAKWQPRVPITPDWMEDVLHWADNKIPVSEKVETTPETRTYAAYEDPSRPKMGWTEGATETSYGHEWNGWESADKLNWFKEIGGRRWKAELEDTTFPGMTEYQYEYEAHDVSRPRDRRYGHELSKTKMTAVDLLQKVERDILHPNPRNKNPSSKKVTKRKATKRPSKSADALIRQAEHLWKVYDNKPLKKNLMAFGKHLGVMKHSKSAKVQKDRRDGMRAFNAEMKLRGWKMPKENPCLGLHFHKEDAEALLEAAKKVQSNPKRKRKKVSKKRTRRAKKNPIEWADYIPEVGWPFEGDIFDWKLVELAETGTGTVAVLRTEGYQIVVFQPDEDHKSSRPTRVLWQEGEEDRPAKLWKLHEEDLPPGTFSTTMTDDQLISAIQWAEFRIGAEAVGYDPDAPKKKQLGEFIQAGLRGDPTKVVDEERLKYITGKGPDIFAGMREGTGTLVKRNPKRRKKVSKKRTRRAKKNPDWYRDPMSGSLERTWQDFGLDYFDEGKRYTSGFRDDLDEQRARFLLDRAYAAAWLHNSLKEQAALSPMMEQEALEVEEDLSWLLQDISDNYKHIKGSGRSKTEFFWVPKPPSEDDRIWNERRKIQTKTPEEAARKIYLQVFGRRTKMPPKPRRRRRKNPDFDIDKVKVGDWFGDWNVISKVSNQTTLRLNRGMADMPSYGTSIYDLVIEVGDVDGHRVAGVSLQDHETEETFLEEHYARYEGGKTFDEILDWAERQSQDPSVNPGRKRRSKKKASKKKTARRRRARKNPGYKQQVRIINYAGYSLAEIKEGPNYIRLDTAGDTWVMFHEDEQNPGRWWWERFEDDEVIASDEKRTTFSQAFVNAMLTQRAKRDAGR